MHKLILIEIIKGFKQLFNLILIFGKKLYKLYFNNYLIYLNIGDWGLGIVDWGLGIGDWAQSPIPNPQSPIPIPHFKILNNCYNIIYIIFSQKLKLN